MDDATDTPRARAELLLHRADGGTATHAIVHAGAVTLLAPAPYHRPGVRMRSWVVVGGARAETEVLVGGFDLVSPTGVEHLSRYQLGTDMALTQDALWTPE